ncbi:MAG: diacylglycerol/lipid kinase family protein, partial [Actinomycetota bacterium]
MDTLLAIVSAHAGATESEAEAAALAVLRAGADVEVAKTSSPDDLRAALEQHPDRHPVVLGGDGSVHMLVAVLHETGGLDSRVVGLVPMGTGNDLARSLGIPLDAEAAAHAVLDGAERRLDLLVDDRGGVVVNAVHLGVGAEAAREATALKSTLGRLSYTVGALLAGLRARGWRLQVTVDGRVLADGRDRVLIVGLSNGSTIGGGTPLGPRAEPDDGMVDVVVAMSTGPMARLAFAAWLALGRHDRRDDVVSTRGRHVVVAGDQTPVN